MIKGNSSGAPEINLKTLWRHCWKKRRWILGAALTGMTVGVFAAFCLPVAYTSTVKWVTDSDRNDIASEFPGLTSSLGLHLGSFRKSQGWDAALYPEIIRSTPFITGIADLVFPEFFTGVPVVGDHTPDWESDYPDPAWMRMIREYRRRVRIETDKKSGLTTLSVTLRTPEAAARAAAEIGAALERYLVAHRTRKVQDDLEFIAARFEEAREAYYTAQQQYARYADENRHIARESVFIERDRLYQQQQLAYTVYTQLSGQLEMARLKVQEHTPVLAVLEPAQIPYRKSSPQRLKIITGALAGSFCLAILFSAFVCCMAKSRNNYFQVIGRNRYLQWVRWVR